MSTLKSFVLIKDRTLYEKINHLLKFKNIASFMQTITHLGDTQTAVFTILIALVLENILAIPIGKHSMLTLVIAQVLVQPIKRVVNRPRPYHTGLVITVMQPPGCQYSFPSGHTACAFSLALSISYILPFLFAPLLILAILVGLSRIALGFHYPTDVLIGVMIAVLAHELSMLMLF